MEAIINNRKIRTIQYSHDNVEHTPEYREYRRQWDENPISNVVADYPIHLDIEVNSDCNLKCVMCFQSFNPPKKGRMSFKTYTKIIDDGAKNGLKSIKLMYRGEPLLHPDIVKMVKYAKQKGIIEVMFNTNGNLLTEKKAKELIMAGLDRIIFSIDGYSKEFYESIRKGGNFNLVLNNVRRLKQLRLEYNYLTPRIRVQMLLLDSIKDKENHVNRYKSFWKKYADDIGIDNVNDYDFSKIKDSWKCKEFKCTSLWQRLFIMWNGEIRLCCGDIYGKMILGNINKNSIKKIWHSAALTKLRELHKQGDSHLINICNLCGGRRTIIENNNLKKEVKLCKF